MGFDKALPSEVLGFVFQSILYKKKTEVYLNDHFWMQSG
jgi:hypothetical protein